MPRPRFDFWESSDSGDQQPQDTRDMYLDAREVRDALESLRGIRNRNTVADVYDDAYSLLSKRSLRGIRNIHFNAMGRWMFIGGEKPVTSEENL